MRGTDRGWGIFIFIFFGKSCGAVHLEFRSNDGKTSKAQQARVFCVFVCVCVFGRGWHEAIITSYCFIDLAIRLLCPLFGSHQVQAQVDAHRRRGALQPLEAEERRAFVVVVFVFVVVAVVVVVVFVVVGVGGCGWVCVGGRAVSPCAPVPSCPLCEMNSLEAVRRAHLALRPSRASRRVASRPCCAAARRWSGA